MQKLSDKIERKFTDVIELSDWEIDTPTGWHDCTHLNQTIEYEVYEILFESGNSIRVADTHIFIDEFGFEVFAQDSICMNLQTKTGLDKVIQINKTDTFEKMYDVTVDSVDHTFYSNNIVSHNTTVVAGYLVHVLLFSDNIPNIAIMANKAAAAREVMQRIQMMYEYLPKWMQKGVKTWNKGNIILEGENGADGAQCFTAATTASGPRGKSVSHLYVDECAIIPNTIADEFFASTFPVISSGEKSKIIMSSTPKGYNHFWKFWNNAEKTGKEWNGYTPIRAHWQEHPKRTQKWADEQLVELGLLKYTQEVECCGPNTNIKLRDKITGEILDLTIKEAFELFNF